MSKEVKFVERLIKLTNEDKITWRYNRSDDTYHAYDDQNKIYYDNVDTITVHGLDPTIHGFNRDTGFYRTVDMSEDLVLMDAFNSAIKDYSERVKDRIIDLDTLFVDESDVDKQAKSKDDGSIIIKLHPELKLLAMALKEVQNEWRVGCNWIYLTDGMFNPSIALSITLHYSKQLIIFYDYNRNIKQSAVTIMDFKSTPTGLQAISELQGFTLAAIKEKIDLLRVGDPEPPKGFTPASNISN